MLTTRCSYAKLNPTAASIDTSNGAKRDPRSRYLQISREPLKKERPRKQLKDHQFKMPNVKFADGQDLRETSSSTTA